MAATRTTPEARAAARAAGLHYVQPYESPGVPRRRAIERERGLAIPPAWRHVWIARDPRGHIQATGRDARGRLQYIYHPRWREVRDESKYGRLVEFTRALPRLRRRVDRDLDCACICREAVTATVVALIESGHLRVGNDEYARTNGTYGATTLECRHLRLHGDHVELRYRGKSGIRRHVDIEDHRLARVVRRIRKLPGRRLFQYRDDAGIHPISSSEVNDYLRSLLGPHFSAKDFRTWAASLWCALVLARDPPPETMAARKRAIVAAIAEVADRLGHTPAVCRKSYIHPAILDAFHDGRLHALIPARLRATPDLRAAERHVLALLAR